MNINELYEYYYVTQYDAVGRWVIRLCKLAWGRKFPPLEPPEFATNFTGCLKC